jgi:hypothetical protein
MPVILVICKEYYNFINKTRLIFNIFSKCISSEMTWKCLDKSYFFCSDTHTHTRTHARTKLAQECEIWLFPRDCKKWFKMSQTYRLWKVLMSSNKWTMQTVNVCVEIQCQLDATDVFYCRSSCLPNTFRAPLCPSSGAREYFTVGCRLWSLVLGFQVIGMVWSWGVCVGFAKHQRSQAATNCIILSSSWWWA